MNFTFLSMLEFIKGSMMNCILCNLEGVCTLKLQGLGHLDEIFLNLIKINKNLDSLKREVFNMINRKCRNYGCVNLVIDRIVTLQSDYDFEKIRIQNIFVGTSFINIKLELKLTLIQEVFRKLEILCRVEDKIRIRFMQLNQLQREIDNQFNEIYTTKYDVLIDNTYYKANIHEIICKLMQVGFKPMIFN